MSGNDRFVDTGVFVLIQPCELSLGDTHGEGGEVRPLTLA